MLKEVLHNIKKYCTITFSRGHFTAAIVFNFWLLTKEICTKYLRQANDFFLIENIDLNQLQKGKKDFLVRILFVSSIFFLNRFNLIRKQERNTMFADMKSVLKCAFEEEDQKKK